MSVIVSISLILLVITYAFAYDLDQYKHYSSTDQMATLGQFGDFLGGTLNPLLALLTVIGLAYTIHLQRKQLHEAQQQYEMNLQQTNKQQFEQFLFNLIELHSRITDNLSISNDVLMNLYNRAFCNDSKRIFEINNHEARNVFNAIFICVIDTPSHDCNVQIKRYERLQQRHNEVLGHYFRNLYHILKTISESDIQDKKKYSNILRSQLSTYELAILLVNCLDGVVDNGEFKKLIIEFEFLEHLPLELTSYNNLTVKGFKLDFIGFEHITEYMPNLPNSNGAFGDNPFFNNQKIKNLLTKT